MLKRLHASSAMAECSKKRPLLDEEDLYEYDIDYDTDHEDYIRPPESKQSRKPKYSGAATYRTKFNPEWKKEFPFIASISKDPYRYA